MALMWLGEMDDTAHHPSILLITYLKFPIVFLYFFWPCTWWKWIPSKASTFGGETSGDVYLKCSREHGPQGPHSCPPAPPYALLSLSHPGNTWALNRKKEERTTRGLSNLPHSSRYVNYDRMALGSNLDRIEHFGPRLPWSGWGEAISHSWCWAPPHGKENLGVGLVPVF